MSQLRLYEISEQYKFLLDDLYNEETGEVNQEVQAKLQALKEPLENKCINVVRVFKSLSAESEAIDKECKAMTARKKSLQSQVNWLKDYLLDNMEVSGVNEIKCPQFVIKLQKNPPAVDMYDKSIVPDMYKKVSVDYDVQSMKDAMLQDGAEIPGVRLVQRNSVRIK